MIAASVLGLPAILLLLTVLPCIRMGHEPGVAKYRRAQLAGVLLILLGKTALNSQETWWMSDLPVASSSLRCMKASQGILCGLEPPQCVPLYVSRRKSYLWWWWEGGEAEVTEHEHKLTNKRHERILRVGRDQKGRKGLHSGSSVRFHQGIPFWKYLCPGTTAGFIESEFLGIKPDKDILRHPNYLWGDSYL